VATNALLERRGARVALVTTEGFADVIEIGRQLRPHLYDYSIVKPEPLVPRERRLEDLGDVLPAVGLHEEELGKWVQPPRRGVEQDLPEPDADPGPSRLALENDVAPACAAELGRAARLRRLSGSFDSFERDEGHRKPIIDDEGFAGKRALRPRTPSGRGRMITGRP